MLTGWRDYKEGHSELKVFYYRFLHLRNTKSYLYIYIYIFCYISCHFSLSDQLYSKQTTGADNTLLLNDSLQGPRDYKKIGGSMLTSYVMAHDMNVQIYVQIFWAIFNLCILAIRVIWCLVLIIISLLIGNQSHLMLSLDHHQPSDWQSESSDA